MVKINNMNKVKLIKLTDSYRFIADSARCSTLALNDSLDRSKSEKTPEDDKRLVTYLLDNRHDSPFEQVSVIYDIITPLFIARQFYRHRSIKTWNDEIIVESNEIYAAFNEMSGRYSTLSDNFYIPKDFYYPHHTNKQMAGSKMTNQESIFSIKNEIEEIYKLSYMAYLKLLNMGLVREQARMVLPQGIFTAFRCSMTVRHLIDFLRLRLNLDTQHEIRNLALLMFHELELHDSVLFSIIESHFIKHIGFKNETK